MGSKILLLCLLVIFTVDCEEKSGQYKRPSCRSDPIEACPMNFAPVCGTDGKTYANECALCMRMQETKTEILITKDSSC